MPLASTTSLLSPIHANPFLAFMAHSCDSRRQLTTSDVGPYPSLHVICALLINSAFRCALAILSRWQSEPERPCSLDAAFVLDRVRRMEAVKALPSIAYYPGLGAARIGLQCAICMSEFEAGELIRLLPNCNHMFHVGCIDRWLVSQPSCPTCRRGLQLYMVEQTTVQGLTNSTTNLDANVNKDSELSVQYNAPRVRGLHRRERRQFYPPGSGQNNSSRWTFPNF